MEEELLQVLAQSALLRNLPKAQIASFAAQGCWLDFAPGQPLRSTQGAALGILCRGEAQIFKQAADGKQVPMNRMRAAQMTGVAGLFGDCTQEISTVVCSTPCTAVFFAEKLLAAFLCAQPQAALNYIAFLTGRIRFLNHKIDGFTGYSARSRVILYLLDAAQGGEQLPPPSMTALAEELNISRASLYRAVEDLRRAGAIEYENGKVTAIHTALLQELQTRREK